MRVKAHSKSIIREILSSKARFISILAIIFLGVAFYSGIKSSGPDLEASISNFYRDSNLMDSKIVSDLGLNDNDLELLKNDENILDYYPTHSLDVNLTNMNSVVKFIEYNPEDINYINKFTIVDGRLPQTSGEIALDEKVLDEGLNIGDEYTIESDKDTMGYFNSKTYKIVGFIKSPMYIDKESRGSTTIGTGSIDYFAVINSSDISMDAYTEVYVRFKNVENIDAYSDDYKDKMEENIKYLKNLFANRSIERIEEVKLEFQQKFNELYKEIEYGNQNLLDVGKEVEEQQSKLNDLDNSKYYFFDRDDNPGYSTYGDSIQSLDNIAAVFPVFFFLVAVLICLTTMTRMVEENRTEIGTLKALGYSDLEISKKFVIYAALASIVGSVLGILVGSNGLPYIVNMAYGDMFNLPKVEIHYYTSYIVQSILISILCTVGASLFVLSAELKENPSNLMRVKAPKIGKKILLERITPLWKRFNFNQKVTFRNLFRYKQRMIMTILGIAGCMAMLVTGFSLNKSNNAMIEKQFNKLMKYDAIVVFNDDSSEEEDENYNSTLTSLDEYESSLDIHQESITFSKEGMNKQSAMMYVPKEVDELNKYVSLNDRKTEIEYKLSNNGVIISEKLAKLLNASVGDFVTLKDSDENSYEVRIDDIAENYVSHYIYMSPEYYKEIFNKDITYNAQFLNLKSDVNEEDIQTTIMESDKVMNITMMSKVRSSSNNSSLGLVMLVIIIASGCLAFVVLYNLININVSERIRELSTIKVLGFFDNEVTMYVFRENIILTLVGILVGSFMGKILYNFILNTAETDTMMMIPDVYMSSYVLSGLMTLLFAFLVMIMMHIKLKNINMIDALKSVE
ncbi:FtsX-like permease family protein [Clostridium nigeriense]|uniref:FtsX-like permease family protein n=1 Tax=Clostridium nigeriense TaxID=1805470 RepID=UPI003D329A39